MVDREARDELIGAVERYLDGTTDNVEFDEAIHAVAADSDDPTVEHVVEQLWLFYDDLARHEVVLSKQEWDWIQRLLLVLASDTHIETDTFSEPHWTQGVAATMLAILALGVACFGLGIVYLMAVPLGVVSMLLSRRRTKDGFWSTREAALVPFASVSELLAVRRGVNGFRKRRYPPDLATRQIRSGPADAAMRLPMVVLWLLFSPLVLLTQLSAPSDTITHVRLSP